MNRIKRGKAVLAMEFLMRSLNDEELIDGWLAYGVADGDITEDMSPSDETLDCYCEDGTFRDLMDCFLNTMAAAKKSGGLYIDKIVSTVG